MQLPPIVRVSGVLGILCFGVSQVIYFFLPSAPFPIFVAHLAFAVVLIGLFFIRGGLELFKTTLELRDRSRRIKSSLRVLFVILIAIFLNALLMKKELFEFDSTNQKIHSLSNETKELLNKLPGKLFIHAFYLGGVIPDEVIRAQLKALEKAGVEVSMVDPEAEPLSLEKYGVTQQETLHFSLTTSTGEQRVARAAHLKSEEQLNLILKKLVRSDSRVVLYSTGHGEPALEDKLEKGALFFKEALEGENLEVKGISLGSISKVDANVSILIIAAPRDNFSEGERRTVAEYIARGGSLILFNEPRLAQEVSLLAKPFGIEVGEDIILEPSPNTGLGIETRVLEFSKDSPITRVFTRGVSLTGSSSVRRSTEADPKLVKELAFSSNRSWAEKNLDLLLSSNPVAARDLEDLPGPVSVAASFDGTLNNSRLKSKVVVFGDSDFIRNAHLRELANAELVLNSINWILGEDLSLQISSRSMTKTATKLTYEERSKITLIGGIFIPELLILVSIAIWYRRGGL
jgi:hypothetical protein